MIGDLKTYRTLNFKNQWDNQRDLKIFQVHKYEIHTKNINITIKKIQAQNTNKLKKMWADASCSAGFLTSNCLGFKRTNKCRLD